MARAIVGEVGVSLFAAGAAFPEILGDSRSAKCCVSKMGQVRSPKRRVRDDDFIFGSCSDYPRIFFFGGSNSRIFRYNLELKIS